MSKFLSIKMTCSLLAGNGRFNDNVKGHTRQYEY